MPFFVPSLELARASRRDAKASEMPNNDEYLLVRVNLNDFQLTCSFFVCEVLEGRCSIQHAAPSRLRLGVGQFFGMVEQSQEYQLAMPFMRSTAPLFRGRLSVSGHYVASFGELAKAGAMAPACVQVTETGGRSGRL